MSDICFTRVTFLSTLVAAAIKASGEYVDSYRFSWKSIFGKVQKVFVYKLIQLDTTLVKYQRQRREQIANTTVRGHRQNDGNLRSAVPVELRLSAKWKQRSEL